MYVVGEEMCVKETEEFVRSAGLVGSEVCIGAQGHVDTGAYA